MEVKFLDLKYSHQVLKSEFMSAFENALEKSDYILSEDVIKFETAFSNYLGARFCIGVGNGLDALKIALMAADIGRGDEVLVPGHTFIATWLAVTEVGATPVPVDCDLNSYNILSYKLEEKISAKTKAILLVHLYGNPCDLEPIRAIAKKRGLMIIEDAAQAHGAKYNEGYIGSDSQLACFSFYPGKNLGCLGDGGAIVTCDYNLFEKIKRIRNYGSTEKYIHEVKGINSRLDSLQASFLRIKLPHLSEWNSIRQETASIYLNSLSDIIDLHLPKINPKNQSAWHLFVIRTKKRDQLASFLKQKGIQTLIHYPIPPHKSKAYLEFNDTILPNTEQISREVLSLPIGPHMSTAQTQYVADQIRLFFNLK